MDEDPEPGDSSGSNIIKRKIRIGSVFSKKVKPNPKQWLRDLFSDRIRYKSSLKAMSSISTVRAAEPKTKKLKQKIKEAKIGSVLREKAKKTRLKQRLKDVFSDTTVYKSGLKRKKKKARKVYVIPKEKPLPPDADRAKKIMKIYPEMINDEDKGYLPHGPEDALFEVVKSYREKNPEFAHL